MAQPSPHFHLSVPLHSHLSTSTEELRAAAALTVVLMVVVRRVVVLVVRAAGLVVWVASADLHKC